MNLAAADIVYSIFQIPQLIFIHISTHPDGLAGNISCILRDGVLAWVGGASSLFTLAAIATERYYAVIYPFRNKIKLTMRKLKVCLWGNTLPHFFHIWVKLKFDSLFEINSGISSKIHLILLSD